MLCQPPAHPPRLIEFQAVMVARNLERRLRSLSTAPEAVKISPGAVKPLSGRAFRAIQPALPI